MNTTKLTQGVGHPYRYQRGYHLMMAKSYVVTLPNMVALKLERINNFHVSPEHYMEVDKMPRQYKRLRRAMGQR